MRIIYLHQYFVLPSQPGGTRSYEMARRLASFGHQVHMVTSDHASAPGRSPRWEEREEAGIHVHRYPVPYSNAMSYSQRIRAFLQYASRSALRAAQLPGDVVFATSTPLTIALPGVYAARRQGIAMVFEVRDLWPDLPIAIGAITGRLPVTAARWLERFAYKNSAQIVAL